MSYMLYFGEDLLLEGLAFYCGNHKGVRGHTCIHPSKYATVFIAHGIELIFKAIKAKKGPAGDTSLYRITNEFKKTYPSINKFASVDIVRKFSNGIKHEGKRSYKRHIFFIEALNVVEQLYQIEYPRRKAFLKKLNDYKNAL